MMDKFSSSAWGATSSRYAKSVKTLSKAKLDEIFNAAGVYLKVKGRKVKAADDELEDDMEYDERGMIRASSPLGTATQSVEMAESVEAMDVEADLEGDDMGDGPTGSTAGEGAEYEGMNHEGEFCSIFMSAVSDIGSLGL